MSCPWECNCRSDKSRVYVGNRSPGFGPEPRDWSLLLFVLFVVFVGAGILAAILL